MRIIAGIAGSRPILAPKGRETRPTLDRVRENLFNILRDRTENARILDLFAGSGALSLEALSRGAAFAVLVDKDREAHLTEKKNGDNLGFMDRMCLMHTDWRKAVSTLRDQGKRFNLIFLDPPYKMTDLTEVTEALVPLSTPDTLVILEHETGVSPLVSAAFRNTDNRKWGFASVSFYRPASDNVSSENPAQAETENETEGPDKRE